MQVWGNYLENNQTQSKLLGHKIWLGISLSLGYRLWLNSYCFTFEPYYRGTCGLSHKITISRKLDQKFFKPFIKIYTIKNLAKYLQRKDICWSLATVVVSLYKLFILLKIPCKIVVLRIVKLLRKVEYLTLPLIKMLNFDSISGLKTSLKFQQTAKVYLIIIWFHTNYLFHVKIHMKYE